MNNLLRLALGVASIVLLGFLVAQAGATPATQPQRPPSGLSAGNGFLAQTPPTSKAGCESYCQAARRECLISFIAGRPMTDQERANHCADMAKSCPAECEARFPK